MANDNDNDNDAPYAPAGGAQAAALLAELDASWGAHGAQVNEATARRLRELGMRPGDIAELLGRRRRS